MKYLKAFLVGFAVVASAMVLIGCSGAYGAPPRLEKHIAGQTLWVTIYWSVPGAVSDTSSDSTAAGVRILGHTVSAAQRADSFSVARPAATTVAQISRGMVCLYGAAKNDFHCLGWADTVAVDVPPPPPPVVTIPPAPGTVTLTARPASTQLWLVASWAAPAGATSFADTLNLNTAPWTMFGGHKGLTATADSFAVPLPTVATPYFICIRSVNSAGSSGTACNSASYTPPPPTPLPGPTLDSLRVKTVGSLSLVFGEQRQFCAMGYFSDGSIHSQGGARCDSLGKALYNVRYSMRPTEGVRLALR